MRKTLALLAIAAARTAHAEPDETGALVLHDPYNYAWGDPEMRTHIGVSLVAGGGGHGFTDRQTDDLIGSSALWTVRVLAGSRTPIGFEVAYAGMHQHDLDGASLDIAARWNMLPHWDWCPFLFMGFGWQHYKTDAMTPITFSIDNDVDMLAVPMGGGLAWRHWDGFVAEARGVFRPVDNPSTLHHTGFSLTSWEASVSVGYEL